VTLILDLPITQLATTLAPLRGPRTDPTSALAPLPLRVAPAGDGTYEVLDGFKRLAHWARDGHTHVPVVVEDAAGVVCKARLLDANAPRRTLSPMDEARVVRSLADDDHVSPAQIAKLLGRGRGWVDRRLTLGRRLAPDVAGLVDTGRLSATTASALATLPRGDQKRLADAIERHGLRTRDAEAVLATWRAAADTPTREALLRDPRSAVPAPSAGPVSPLGPTARELQARFDQTERALEELARVDLAGFPETDRRVLEASQRRLAAQVVRLARAQKEEAFDTDPRGTPRTGPAHPATHPDPRHRPTARTGRENHPPGAGPTAPAPGPSKLAPYQALAQALSAQNLRSPRILRELRARGYTGGGTILKAFLQTPPLFAGTVAASLQGRVALGPRAGQPLRRLRSAAAAAVSAPRCARLEGFSLHADVAVPAHRRDRLEHLCRYLLRPPLALERLTETSGGQLLYEFRRPWADGSRT